MYKKAAVLLSVLLIFFSLCMGSETTQETATTTQAQSAPQETTTTSPEEPTTQATPSTAPPLDTPLSDDQIEYCNTAADAGTCDKISELGMLVSVEECCEYLNVCCE